MLQDQSRQIQRHLVKKMKQSKPQVKLLDFNKLLTANHQPRTLNQINQKKFKFQAT